MVDSDYGDCNLKKTNDVPCSIEREVIVIPPDSVPGYAITSHQAPIVVSDLSTSLKDWDGGVSSYGCRWDEHAAKM